MEAESRGLRGGEGPCVVTPIPLPCPACNVHARAARAFLRRPDRTTVYFVSSPLVMSCNGKCNTFGIRDVGLGNGFRLPVDSRDCDLDLVPDRARVSRSAIYRRIAVSEDSPPHKHLTRPCHRGRSSAMTEIAAGAVRSCTLIVLGARLGLDRCFEVALVRFLPWFIELTESRPRLSQRATRTVMTGRAV